MNTNADVIRVELTTEASAASTLKPKMRAHAKDTRRLVWMEGDSTLRYAWDSTRLADQTSTYGTALIGSPGITGITPNGGTSGAAATLANMLSGFRDSVILKSPYNSTINTIQPTADYVPLTVKGFASGVSNLLSIQTSSTAVAWFDNAGNLTLSQSIAGNVALSVINGNNSSGSANAKLLLSVGGASAGDPFVNYSINGGQQWSEGIDRSDSFKYKISESNAIGTNDALIIAPSGAITLNRAGIAASTLDVTGGNLTVSRSSTSGVYSVTSNTNNTNGNAHAIVYVSVLSGGGDAYINWTVPSTTDWSMGLDNSDSDNLKIGRSSTLGAGLDAISWDVSLNTTLYASLIFGANSTGGAGRISRSSGNGLEIRGVTGSSYDLVLKNNSGTDVFQVAAGTTNISMAGDLTISRFTPGLQNLFSVINSDNTDTNSRARVFIGTGGSSAGDPIISFNVASVTTWSIGIDNSVGGDPLKISFGSNLGTNDALIIDSNLLASFGGSVSMDGGTNTFFRPPRATSDPTSPAEGWMYWNTAGKHLLIHNGTSWVQIV